MSDWGDYDDDLDRPLTAEERHAHVHKTARYSATKRGEVTWALQYIITNHYYDTNHRSTSKPNDPGWHECRCGLWEGYWSDYNTHVAQDQMKMLVGAGLLAPEKEKNDG